MNACQRGSGAASANLFGPYFAIRAVASAVDSPCAGSTSNASATSSGGTSYQVRSAVDAGATAVTSAIESSLSCHGAVDRGSAAGDRRAGRRGRRAASRPAGQLHGGARWGHHPMRMIDPAAPGAVPADVSSRLDDAGRARSTFDGLAVESLPSNGDHLAGIRLVLCEEQFLAREGIIRVPDSMEGIELVASRDDLEGLRAAGPPAG